MIAACCWFIRPSTPAWATGNFPLALIGQVYLETNKRFLWHTWHTWITHIQESIRGNQYFRSWLKRTLVFLLSDSTFLWRKQKNFAAFPLACEQALCLGKGWKNREEREGKGFFSPFPQTESLFTLDHTLPFCHKPVKNVPQDWIHHDCQHFSIAHV